MNKILKEKYLPFLILGLGGIVMVMQWALVAKVDSKGLLPETHILYIMGWVLAVLSCGVTAAVVWKLNGPNRYNANFPASIPGTVGAFLMALGIGASLLFHSQDMDGMTLAWQVLGILSIAALFFTGICRMGGRRPAFFFHGALCLFFTLQLVCRCRIWSSETQVERYGFALLASVGLMLAAYYRAAFDSGIGRRRMQLFVNLMTCFFCLAAVPGGGDPVLYLTGAVWTVTNLCVLTPPKRRRRPRPAPPPQES